MSDWTREEMKTVASARLLWDGCVCFVGIGLPSAACNLARLTHAPDIVLIYESGTLGTRPNVLPLSIGDGELAVTAACVVPLPEVFSYFERRNCASSALCTLQRVASADWSKKSGPPTMSWSRMLSSSSTRSDSRRHGTFVRGRERPAHLVEQQQLFFDDGVRQERLRGPAGGNLPM